MKFTSKMYCIDSSASEPIMLINKQIGKISENDMYGEYINCADWQQELMYLDTLGKKRIKVYINCDGGNPLEAMKLCDAILQSKTPVDTYNTGLCASAACMPYMCGRKRYMYDYALFMTHPVGGGSDNAEGTKARAALTDSISTIISSNSNLTQDTVKTMMMLTTWASASTCLDQGICTDIIATKDTNKKYMPTNEAKAMLAYCNKLTQEIIDNQNVPTMDLTTITNKLKLQQGSDLETINNAIDVIVSGKAELTNMVNSLTVELDEAKQQLAEAQAKVEELTAAAQEAENKAAEVEAEAKATELVNQFKEKIGSNTDLWHNKAKANYDETKQLLESLGVTSKGNPIQVQNSGKGLNVAGIMNDIYEKTKINKN